MGWGRGAVLISKGRTDTRGISEGQEAQQIPESATPTSTGNCLMGRAIAERHSMGSAFPASGDHAATFNGSSTIPVTLGWISGRSLGGDQAPLRPYGTGFPALGLYSLPQFLKCWYCPAAPSCCTARQGASTQGEPVSIPVKLTCSTPCMPALPWPWGSGTTGKGDSKSVISNPG